MKTSLLVTVAALGLAASAIGAAASCGDPRASHANVTLPPGFFHHDANRTNSASIMGFWQVDYLVGGNLAFQSFEQWHSDGLEFEFADIPTISGDVCMGVYSVKGKTYSLYHTAWTFDGNGNPNGTMVLTHQDKVAKSGDTFTGVFDLKFYDLNGNLTNEIAGDTQAKRISAP